MSSAEISNSQHADTLRPTDDERTTEQVIIISTPQELEVGQPVESLSRLQHLTLFPWITLEKDQWPQFDAHMQHMLQFDSARNMKAGEIANFGSEEKPHFVRKLIGLDADLRVGIASGAIDLGARYDPRFTEFNTESHVSIVKPDEHADGESSDTHQLQEGEIFPIASMTAIARDHAESQKIVRAVYKWARPSRFTW